MIFKLLLAFFCCFTIIRAIDTDSTIITENTKEADLYVHKNSVFTVFLEGYYDTTDDRSDVKTVFENGEDRWILENVQELAETNIKPLNLTNSNWGDVPNASSKEHKIYISSNYGVIAEFSFKVDESVGKDLPQLKFIFKSQVKEDMTATVNLLLTEAEPVDMNEYRYNLNDGCGNNEKTFIYQTFYSSSTAKIGNQSSLMIIFDGMYSREKYNNKKIGSEYRWFFDNDGSKEVIINGDPIPFIDSESIELVKTSSFYGGHEKYIHERSVLFDKENIQYAFTFKINELNKRANNININFAFKESQEDTAPLLRKRYELNNANEKKFVIYDTTTHESSIEVQKNNIVSMGIKGYEVENWHLENLEDIKNSEDYELIKLFDNDQAVYSPVTLNGDYIYKFYIKETARENSLEPAIKLVNADKSRVITTRFYIKGKSLSDLLPSYDYENNEEGIAYVERNSILKITVKKRVPEILNDSDFSENNFENDCEIENSNVELIDVSFPFCYSGPFCIKDVTFYFLVRNVNHDEELPKITLNKVYGDYANGKLEVALKLKKNSSEEGEEGEECTFGDYKCCTGANPQVYYQDEDGDWSVEHGEWCFIKEGVKNTTPELIRACESYALDLPCCTDRTAVTDIQRLEYRNIGIQDGQKCGLYTCIYTGDYPVCETTTEVVYTDTEKWGVENDKWCILCL